MVKKGAERDVRLGEIGRKRKCVLRHAADLRQLRVGYLFKEPMTVHSVPNKTSHGEGEIRIARDSLLVPGSSLFVRFRSKRIFGQTFLVFAFQEQIVGSGIFRWRGRERVGFGRRKFRL